MPDNAVTDYWLKYYAAEVCKLCGNWGVIDTTRTATSPAGFSAGGLNFCICPNGQALREGGADINRVRT